MKQQSLPLGDVPACLVSSESTEWYTPKKYVEAARDVMNGIDCDPASNEIANRIVQAPMYYTKETNGFTKPWPGKVWLNPPYGHDDKKGNQARWSARLIEQYQAGITKQAVLLVNAVTGNKWFQPLWNYPICFPDHRINFYSPHHEKSGPTHGSAFVYFGSDVETFRRVFSQFGRVIYDAPAPGGSTLWEVAS